MNTFSISPQDACKAGQEAVDALLKTSLAAVAGDEKRRRASLNTLIFTKIFADDSKR